MSESAKVIQKLRAKSEAAMLRSCEKCGATIGSHTLSKLIFCLYGGVPKKDGEPLRLEDAEDIVRSVKERLS